VLLSRRDAPIRILVDHHHDTAWRDAGHGLGGGPTQVTICRESLKWGALKRYHVLIIEASTPARFTANELKAVERFVAEGGGLLLAASAPTFELMAESPTNELPAGAVAARFGFRFLSPEDCAGEVEFDRNFRRGYPREQVVVGPGAPDGFGPHPPGAITWAPIEPPEGAKVLLEHPETGEPLAALAEHGRGRVCVVGTRLNRFNQLAHLHPLLGRLAEDAGDRPGREIPFELGPPPKLHEAGRLSLILDEPLTDRAEEIADVVRRFDEFMRGFFGDGWKMPKRVEVVRSCAGPDGWDSDPFVSAAGCGWALAYNAAFALALRGLRPEHAGELLVTLFPEFTLLRHIAIRFVQHMGFAEPARRLRDIAARQVDEADPDRTQADLARVYWATEKWHPKGMWLIAELERRYGDDFLRRVFDAIPKKREDDKLPRAFAWAGDKAAYYLSLAAGEDLAPWLAEIGTVVHPLPLVRQDDDGFATAMREALVVGATTGPAARRLEALADLAALEEGDRAKLPDRARALVEACAQATASDARGEKLLRRLARRDGPQAAVAALQLVSAGRRDAADRLADLASRQDVRFRLAAGHVLRKAGRDMPELSLAGMVDGGERVGELDVALRDTLDVHPRVEGYEVANVVSESGPAGFPHGNVATRFYVYWVHTSPQWRRAGLSRLAFAASMEHEEAQRCAAFALSTGTRNMAHAMYADFAFVDTDYGEEATKSLALGTPCSPPDGVVIRPMEDGDREQVRRFLLDYHDNAFAVWRLAPPTLGEGTRVSLGHKNDKLIGVAVGRGDGGESARVIDVAVEEGLDGREEIGVALLARVHRLLADDGAKTARARIAPNVDLLGDVLARAGYARRAGGGVNMFGIRDLGQLLDEIRPLYERRLADKKLDWAGRVVIIGDRLRAGLEVEKGAVQVIEAEPRPSDIVLRTRDDVITRFVIGRETPLEGYLQRHADIEPQVNASVMKLLETLFPECPCVSRWGW